MGGSTETCWTVIRGASEGRAEDRARFVASYTPVVRAYLGARWRGGRLVQEIDDAMQEVFVHCFREGGVLDTVDPERGAFRPFLYGAVRNVARQVERKKQRRREQRLDTGMARSHHDPDGDTPERAFDRAWAHAIVDQATARHRERAEAEGDAAVRRVELLRLRFQAARPIREIAREWEVDAAKLHHEFAKARQEFQSALVDVVLFHSPGSRKEARDEARRLLEVLGS